MTPTKKNVPVAGQGNEDNESIRERSTDDLTVLRMHRRGSDTRDHYAAWNGDKLPKDEWVSVLIPRTAAAHAFNGPVPMILNREDARAQGNSVRAARRRAKIEQRVGERIGELEDKIRAEVEAELTAEGACL